MVEEEDLLDKLEDVDHTVCQQATDALLTAESEADQVWYGTVRHTAESEADQVWCGMTHRRIGSSLGMEGEGATHRRIGSRSDKDKKTF